MSDKGSLRKVLLCGMLALASMFGAPIRADEIEKLMRAATETKIVYTIDGDGNDSHRDTEDTEPE